MTYDAHKILFFDGAMGTQLQNKGLKLGTVPETLNITEPEMIKEIHNSYIDAGSNIISTNTFGANRKKLKATGFSVEEIVTAAVKVAKEASRGRAMVALDIGPIGELLSPMGTLSFDEAYEIFKEQMIAGEKAGADFIMMETFTDLQEAKCAVLAAKENTKLPVGVTMSFEKNGRTFTGCSPETMALTLSPLADMIGINCSLGPEEILPIAETLLEWTNKPVIIQPNAGLPREVDGRTVFDVSPYDFANLMIKYKNLGVNIIGGCCGTTPAYIKLVVDRLRNSNVAKRNYIPKAAVCSATKVVEIDKVRVIGERINPTGKKLFKQALRDNDIDYIMRQGLEQVEAGADILDVNVGLPEIDEAEMMKKVVTELQSIVDVPLQIDSTDVNVIEQALRCYTGKAIVNSVNGEDKILDTILPVVKKYGASVVGLTLDENGIPKTAEERFKIAEKILNKALAYGIKREDIYIDCLTLTVSAQQKEAVETIKAVRMVKEKLGLKTVLGVSNISFGLPRREIINELFLSQTLEAGLDLPILNPNAEGMMNVIFAHNVLHNIDVNSEKYIQRFNNTVAENTKVSSSQITDLRDIIVKGLKDEAKKATVKLLEEKTELEIVNEYLIPSLDIVGEKYEKGIIFLPQLIQSAETVKQAFEVLKERLSTDKSNIDKGTIVLATVKGDIHDIGKNIVKVILENYGYRIIDLGRDVPCEAVVEAAKKHNVKLVGLSALMTTTVKSMQETIALLKKECPDVITFVGGAVLNSEYADMIGADYYAKDAKEAVEVAKKIFNN